MSVASYQSEPAVASGADPLAPLRVRGGVAAHFRSNASTTTIAELAESGGYRLFVHPTGTGGADAVIVNTGGGLVGGDRVHVRIDAEAGADIAVATQAAERVYRSSGHDSELSITLRAEAGATLAWLPQETILFSGARLHRRFDVDLASGATLLMIEMMTFGRVASGERPGDGHLRDRWRIRRGDRLIFAEEVRLSGHVSDLLSRPAVAASGRAVATIVLVADAAEERLAGVRNLLDNATSLNGASAWDGMLHVRFLADDPRDVLADASRCLRHLHTRALPRVWPT